MLQKSKDNSRHEGKIFSSFSIRIHEEKTIQIRTNSGKFIILIIMEMGPKKKKDETNPSKC